ISLVKKYIILLNAKIQVHKKNNNTSIKFIIHDYSLVFLIQNIFLNKKQISDRDFQDTNNHLIK
ncbi:hypothetical protein, partial [Aggregatibacter actinomycetemcomitans]|uniref:hypothetical protein n=1 Tax=Aggregatibacter actinomycetemcomitans TaxID=714 RepID=UPI00197BF207